MSTPDLVEALARSGDEARAEDALRGLEERVGDAGRRISARAALERCSGILGRGGAWEESFERALALHDRVSTPFERARTELCYAERLRRARRRSDARARLHRAVETFDALGAVPWSDRARAELRASGETARRRSSPVEALTPQELTVARLVAGGATNREAAAALFVSPKTVEFHLGNAYRKLDVRSRTELVRTYAHELD
jgi:DNA-binding CsgD family transcriptional regulator